MKKALFTSILVGFSFILFAQSEYHFGDVLDIEGDGILFDSGGANDGYSNYEDHGVLLSDSPGTYTMLFFEEFDLAGGDTLSIIGDDILHFGGTDLLGDTIFFYSSYLALSFESNGSETSSGFKIHFKRIGPAQNFRMKWETDYSQIEGLSVLNLCEPQIVNFSLETEFYQNFIHYLQSEETTNYIWTILHDDDTVCHETGVGMTSFTYYFQTEGYHEVLVEAFDQWGFYAMDTLRLAVTNGPLPHFEGMLYPDVVCMGEVFSFQEDFDFYINLISDTIIIPDGNGAEYTFELPVNVPDDYVVSEGLYMPSICINMEHSYLGDLTVWLECPSGDSLVLFDPNANSVGGVFLGEPVDDESIVPGIGYEYCWDQDGTETISEVALSSGLTYNYIDALGNSYTNKYYVPAGGYKPNGDWSDLIGCPVGGNWLIHIIDHYEYDNGFVFNVDIDFGLNLSANEAQNVYNVFDFSDSPDNSTFHWAGDGILSQSGGDAEVVAMEAGWQSYGLTVNNPQGCSYFHEYSVFVNQDESYDCNKYLSVGQDEIICGNVCDLNVMTNADSIWWQCLGGSGNYMISDTSSYNPVFSSDLYDQYMLICFGYFEVDSVFISDSLLVTFVDQPIVPDFDINVSETELFVETFYTGALDENYDFNWFIPDADTIIGYGSGPVRAYFENIGEYEVGLSIEYGCVSDTNILSVSMLEVASPTYTVTPPTCYGVFDASILIQHDSIEIDFVFFEGEEVDSLLTGLGPGVYAVEVHLANGLIFEDFVEITSPDYMDGNIFSDINQPFCGLPIMLEVPDSFVDIVWMGVEESPTYELTAFHDVWAYATDLNNCVIVDTLRVVYDTIPIQPIISGYLPDGNIVSTWNNINGVFYNSIRVYLGNEQGAHYLVDYTTSDNNAWVANIPMNAITSVHFRMNNACDEELISDTIDVFALSGNIGLDWNVELSWQAPNLEFVEDSLEILIDEEPFGYFGLYDIYPISQCEYIMEPLNVDSRIRLRVDLFDSITLDDVVVHNLYSNELVFESLSSDNKLQSSFVVYPNPFDEEIIYKCTETTNETVTLTLVDGLGHVIYLNDYSNIHAEEIFRLDTKALKPGLYILNILSASYSDNIKLIKQ